MTKKRKFKSQAVREKDIERVRINFGARTRYRPEKDDIPVHDRGRKSRPFRPSGLDDHDPDEFDEIAGNFGDWGDQ